MKPFDQLQSADKRSILRFDITIICATTCVSSPSKSKATVFQKHILKTKAHDPLIQAKKKLFCLLRVNNYLCNILCVKFLIEIEVHGGMKSKNRHPS